MEEEIVFCHATVRKTVAILRKFKEGCFYSRMFVLVTVVVKTNDPTGYPTTVSVWEINHDIQGGIYTSVIFFQR